MDNIEIKKGIYWVGVKNPELRVFDIVMTTKRGTTYNSYLIVDEKIVLVDSVKDGYYDDFIKEIKGIIGERPIDYVVVQHTEPDHSGSLVRVLDEYKDAVVVASKPALVNVKNIINREFKSMEAREDLNIGSRTLKFISAPFLHWPDTIYTYVENDKVLFTCDSFGCHFCDEGIYNDTVGDFAEEFRYYYDVIMGPFKKYVLTAVDRIKPLDIEVIAPSHGPIHRENPWKYVELYKEWSSEVIGMPEDKTALVLYVSAYGYTKDVALSLAEGLKEAGIKVEAYDITEKDILETVNKIEKSKALIIGSPTINQDAVKPVWDLLSLVSPITNRGKLALAFGSYGWSGEAVPLMMDRLKGLKFKVIEPGFKVILKPTKEDLDKAKAKGKEIGELI